MNHLKRKFRWQTILTAILIFSSTFILLDAFLVPKTYAVVAEPIISVESEVDVAQTNESSASVEAVVESELDESGDAVLQTISASTTVIITENSYSDENITINVEKLDENGVVFYVADVQIADASLLKTAFANDTYGRNITETTSDIADDNNAIFAINGDYYGFRDTGLVIRNGVLYRDITGGPSGSSALIIDSKGNLEIIDMNTTSGSTLMDAGVLQGFSFGPVLVEDGVAASSYNTSISTKANPRTAIGQISPLHYLFIVVEGRSQSSSGMTLQQLAQEFIKRGATVAYNLDGGGSSSMILNGMLVNTPAEKRNNGERKISDIIYIGY